MARFTPRTTRTLSSPSRDSMISGQGNARNTQKGREESARWRQNAISAAHQQGDKNSSNGNGKARMQVPAGQQRRGKRLRLHARLPPITIFWKEKEQYTFFYIDFIIVHNLAVSHKLLCLCGHISICKSTLIKCTIITNSS
jgi:hypothetical protein